MAENTKIQWATSSFNPWIGCTKVATGCQNCYAEALSGRLGVTWGPSGTRRRTAESTWKQVERWSRWNHRCMNCGNMCFHTGKHPGEVRSRCCNANAIPDRPRVFPSLCDPFEDWQGPILNSESRELWLSDEEPSRYVRMPIAGFRDLDELEKQNVADGTFRKATMADVRLDFFALIDRTSNLDWLLLTKRPKNIRSMWPSGPNNVSGDSDLKGMTARRRNVWLLYSASTQADLESGLPHLLACRDLVPVIGLSLEPLVGPIILNGPCGYYCDPSVGHVDHRQPDWVIVGGESGPRARPCNVEWIRDIVRQCAAAGVPCFVKQLGANVIDPNSTASCSFPESMCWPDGFSQDGQRIRLQDPKGGDWSEWPEDLRVREFPIIVPPDGFCLRAGSGCQAQTLECRTPRVGEAN